MQEQPVLNLQLQFLMQELKQVESAIQASQKWFATLEGRREAMTAELEHITRLQPVSTQIPVKTIRLGFEYRGIVYEHRYSIDIYIHLLRHLWTDFPDRRETMAQAMGSCGRKRPYVAKTPAELFPGKPPAFADRHSRKLVGNWHIDTNLSSEQIRTILLAAIAAAGLSLGKDVKINWKRTQTSSAFHCVENKPLAV
ncbi:hypothetical protein SAMN05216404_11526 [Nitrosospira multiformis]|uniref:Uncharacterized protein n=1 Tax=Nitrosospira multiformis TaxID=1231 RepID=A0A1H8N4X5_9PROT|nr:hypothetical protein [Nitrosospira multiformis]SEO24657.1 hypothetical protein SAMN05216404_11526 [Nitrosospira multiformis]